MKNRLVPRLRFKEFSGEWEETAIKSIGKVVTGSTPSKKQSDYWDGNFVWATAQDFNSKYIYNSVLKLTDEGKTKTRIIPKNSVLVTCIASIGLNAINKVECGTNQQINSIICKPSYFYEFIYYAIEANLNRLRNLAGQTAVPIINKSSFEGFTVLIPSIDEQQKIATALSSLDTLIESEQTKLEQLQEHKKGLMQNLFPQEGETMPKVRFKEFENDGEWERKSFEDLFEIGNGRDYKHLEEGDIPVYGSGGYMLSVNDYLYEGDSVCIGRKGTINNPIFLTGKFWTVDTLFYTHGFKDCLPKYILYVFENINWLNYNEAGGVPSLSKRNIEKITVSIPKLEEQQKIADTLSSLDNLMSSQTEYIKLLHQHKKGLMQELFPSAE